MTWQEFGALGEVVGGTAAVILLGYIAYQIRQNLRMLEQNARATRAATYRASNEFWDPRRCQAERSRPWTWTCGSITASPTRTIRS
jgi:hypothetical protein